MEPWLEESRTCRPHLILQNGCSPPAPWVTSGLLHHRGGLLRGLCLHLAHRPPRPGSNKWQGSSHSQGPWISPSTWRGCQMGENPPQPPLPLQLHLWQEQRHISHLPFPKHFPQRTRALCRALGWEGCIGTQESRGRERLQAQSCNLQDVNGLMEGLVNTFQEVRASGSHYKAWRKEFSNNKLRLTFSSRSYVNI